jgi:hypothetical protein
VTIENYVLVPRELVFGLHPPILENALVTRYHLGLFQRFLSKNVLKFYIAPKDLRRENIVFLSSVMLQSTGQYTFWNCICELFSRVFGDCSVSNSFNVGREIKQPCDKR